MREVFAIARRARAHGNRPFGALLVAGNGAVLAAAENSQMTDEQVLAHAEMNLLHRAVKDFTPDVLASSTLYTSAEPCAMCAGAIFWSGVSRLVFGLSGDRLHELSGFRRTCWLPARATCWRAPAARSRSSARCSKPRPRRFSRKGSSDAEAAPGARDRRVLRRPRPHGRVLQGRCSRSSRCSPSDRVVAFDAGEGTVLLLFQRGVSDQPFETPGGLVPGHISTGPAHLAFAIDRERCAAVARPAGGAALPVESRVDWPRGGHSIYFRDPDGRSVELATPGTWPCY